jgi:hypothetical protein
LGWPWSVPEVVMTGVIGVVGERCGRPAVFAGDQATAVETEAPRPPGVVSGHHGGLVRGGIFTPRVGEQ